VTRSLLTPAQAALLLDQLARLTEVGRAGDLLQCEPQIT